MDVADGTSRPAPIHPSPTLSRRLLYLQKRRRRILYSLLAIGLVLLIGTLGFFALTGSGWVDSFYFESMLATGQGPPFPLTSNSAKLFASLMAFVSVGTVISTLVLNLGPILAVWWREAVEHTERELREFAQDVETRVEHRGRDR